MADNSKLTCNQKLVLDKLLAASAPLSAYALLDDLRDHGFRAPLQVYRALKALTVAGKAHRLESLNAFVACCGSHGKDANMIAFVICSDCGQVSEFADEIISNRLHRWVNKRGFQAFTTAIEIRGKCRVCKEPG